MSCIVLTMKPNTLSVSSSSGTENGYNIERGKKRLNCDDYFHHLYFLQLEIWKCFHIISTEIIRWSLI